MDSYHMPFYYTAQSILLDIIFALRNIIEPLLCKNNKKVKESMHQSRHLCFIKKEKSRHLFSMS